MKVKVQTQEHCVHSDEFIELSLSLRDFLIIVTRSVKQLSLQCNVGNQWRGTFNFCAITNVVHFNYFIRALRQNDFHRERVKDMILYLLFTLYDRLTLQPHYKAVCDEFFQPGLDFYELLQGADLWLMRDDFVFKLPPTMHYVIYMTIFQFIQFSLSCGVELNTS
jgi:hypothetical protein